MEGPRAPFEMEMPTIFGFLKNQLRPHESWGVDNEYPTAFSSNNRHNIRVISDAGHILAHAVLKPLIIKTPSVIWKVAAIGSVVTSPEHRQQGLSRQIMESCITEAKNQDCDLALLWTDLYDFYRKWDFELAGQEYAFIIDRPFDTKRSDLRLIKGPQISAESVLKLYNQHGVTSLRTADEIKKFLNIPNSNVYSAWDNNNNLMAYAIEGKGADLQGYIHEWGGNIPALMYVINQILKDQNRSLTWIVPNHSQNLIRQLQNANLLQNEGYLGMIKILNPNVFFSKVKKTARNLGILDIILEERNNEFLFGCGQDIVVINDIKTLVQIIFGPYQEIPYFNEDTRRKLAKVFPMPLWIWGWDSI